MVIQMRHSEVIYLLSHSFSEDSVGNQIPTTSERMIYANEFEVGSAEFYNAAVNGLKAVKRFEIYSFEYKDESQLKHDGKVYNIIRVQKKGEKTRVTCERDVGNG
jgi:hypothetical protein